MQGPPTSTGTDDGMGREVAALSKVIAETYSIRLYGIAASFLTTVVVARVLGPDGRGVYAAVIALTAIFVQLSNLGLPGSNTYLVARKPEVAPQLVGTALAVSAVIGVAAALVLIVVTRLLPNAEIFAGVLLVLAVVWIPCGLAYALLQGIVIGFQRFRLLNLADFLQRTLTAAAVAAFIYFGALSATSAFAAGLLALLGSCAVLLFALRTSLGTIAAPSFRVLVDNLPYSAKIYVASVFTFLVMRIDMIVVQQILGSSEAGLLSVAVSMADAFAVLPVAVGAVMFPHLAKESVLSRRWARTKRMTLSVAAIVSAALGVFCAIAHRLIPLVFGDAFGGAVELFYWLAPGILFLAVTSVLSSYVASVGQPSLYVFGTGLGLAVAIGIEIAFVETLGLWFAAACISLTCLLFAATAYATCAVFNRGKFQG
jgi:O-antigen/teichoic acid export membrane protein